MEELNTTSIAQDKPAKPDHSNLIWGTIMIIVGLIFLGGIVWTYFKTAELNAMQQIAQPEPQAEMLPIEKTVQPSEEISTEKQVEMDNTNSPKAVADDIIKEAESLNDAGIDTTFSEMQLGDIEE